MTRRLNDALLTTKRTKATKGSDFFAHKLRALGVLRGEIFFSLVARQYVLCN
jgi:hypothetical protein